MVIHFFIQLAAIIVYDLGDIETFKEAKIWTDELQKFVAIDLPIAIAGNKSDLPQRVVPEKDLLEYFN